MNAENPKPKSDGWTLPLGRMFGIDVRIHLTFFLLLGFIGVSHWLATGSIEATVGALLFLGALFASVGAVKKAAAFEIPPISPH